MRHQIYTSRHNDILMRGTARQIIEKWEAKAKEAQGEKDIVLYHSYMQQREHYVRGG